MTKNSDDDGTINKGFDYDILVEESLKDVVKKVYDSFICIVQRELKNTNNSKKSKNISLGEYKGKEVHKGEGKYGPYILYNKKFKSISAYLKNKNKTLNDIKLSDCENIL